MPFVGRLLPLLAVALAATADAPPEAPPPAAPSVPPAALAADDDIRNAFAGKAACQPDPSPVGVGPHEFRPNGEYARARDLASAHGRYAISNGKICVTLAGSAAPDFCFAVLNRNGSWLFRLEEPGAGTSRHQPTTVEPCPLP